MKNLRFISYLDKSDKTVKDFLEKTGEIKSSISGVDQQTRNLISVLNNNQSRGTVG